MASRAEKRTGGAAESNPASFQDKVALITGGASGIGWGTAHTLSRGGAAIVIVDRDAAAAEEAAHALIEQGGKAIAVVADVGDEAAVDAMLAETVKAFGRLDYAFNNAGIAHPNMPSADIEPDVWDNVMRVNVRGVWLCMRAEIPQMLANGGGAIVNTASISALRGMPGLSGYSASKHAVLGLTRAAARDYAAQGVRINAICPGAVHTPMTDKALEGLSPEEAQDMLKQRASYHAIGRLGTIDEIANAVCFLLSEQSSFIVGQGISADGGWSV